MTSYFKFVLVWMVITKGLESFILQINIQQRNAFWIFNQISCPLPNSEDFKKYSNSESGARCSLTVYEARRWNGKHEKNLYWQTRENTLTTHRKMPKCDPHEHEKNYDFVCTISERGSIGDYCITNNNCVNNTVCKIDSVFGSCICQDGFKKDNGNCIKEKVKLGEQCYDNKQCEHSNAMCNNQICSCNRGYIQVENNCVEGNKAVGFRCQYHQQCTGTPNAGLCLGNSSYFMCSCKSDFVKINGSCIEKMKLGENCTSNDQCTQKNARCRKKLCSCKKAYLLIENNCVEGNITLGEACNYQRQCQQFATCEGSYCSCQAGYIQIENNCVEGNKTLNVPCMYHQQCTGTPHASLCVGNASSFLCSCVVGFLESNGSCIELSEHVIPNIDKTFFDTKAFMAIFSGVISLIVGASLTALVFAVYMYRNKSRYIYIESGQNLRGKQHFPSKRGLSCSTTGYHDSQDGKEMECKSNDNKNSDAVIEVAHQENDRNQSDHDHDPCLYNHLNEEDELECTVENNYDTAQNELQNDSENSYASVQSRKGSSKQLIVDDVYMPVIVENEL